MSTITEALAEIKTIGKRIEKKREFIGGYLGRQEGAKDPLEKDGGSIKVITEERQSIADLEGRVIALRAGIRGTNEYRKVTIGKFERTIADWLTWRREVAPGQQQFLNKLRSQLSAIREQTKRQGAKFVSVGDTAETSTDVLVNIDERELAKQIEELEEVLGTLDGQLSLVNATAHIVE
jgi:hypothetical protein